ncbi:ABC transporter permease [Chloroflexota bacterium]
MGSYILRRLLIVIPTMFMVTVIVFCLVRLLPGDIVDLMMVTSEHEFDREWAEAQLGLDAPLIIQYGRWMGLAPMSDGSFRGIFQGDFGLSWWTWTPVTSLLALKWPTTFQLGIMALIVSNTIAVPVGIYSAMRQDTWGDYIARSAAILAISVPAFWLGTMIIVFPSLWWGYMPPLRLIHFTEDPIGNLKQFIIPAIVMGMVMSGQTMRMTRTMMLEVLRQDYIRTAWAKGLKERIIITRHALKNALIPVVTQMGLQIPVLLGGSVIIEQIFSLPGVGRLLIQGAHNRDYPLLTGVMVLFAGILLLINLLIDIFYATLDPRIHYR